ncbi:MAG: xylulokinase [Pseudonocardiales bacterium]|nr:xylulokinase [Pseudonocardiales bacterium]
MIIAHDLGTTGDKASLVDSEGRVRASLSRSYATTFGPGGTAEQDPQDWWQSVSAATRGLLAETGIPAHRIEAISFSGQMMGAVLVDEAGDPVRPAIIWADTRSGRQSEQLIARFGLEQAYAITGHRLNPTYTLSKVMWVRDEEPQAFSRARRVLQAKDFIVHRLTGRMLTDPSDASSTNAFDQTASIWSTDLIAAAELNLALFPEIVPSTQVVGTVTGAAAAYTGLAEGTPVVIGGGDGPMAALGAGVLDPGDGGYAYLGTSSWVSIATSRPLHDPAMQTMTFNHVVPGAFVPTATMQTGGGALEWLREVLDPGELTSFGQLLSAMAGVQAATDGLFFLPYLLGERSPYWNPQARAAFIGLCRHHTQAHLTRAVVEGVAFNLRTGLLAFASNGTAITRVDAIGGAAASGAVLQILADVWGVPVASRDLAAEANALGAAVVGGVGVGMFGDLTVARSLSRRQQDVRPDMRLHSDYTGGYQRFVDAYRRLESWFASS